MERQLISHAVMKPRSMHIGNTTSMQPDLLQFDHTMKFSRYNSTAVQRCEGFFVAECPADVPCPITPPLLPGCVEGHQCEQAHKVWSHIQVLGGSNTAGAAAWLFVLKRAYRL
jgi:hypothetical protein